MTTFPSMIYLKRMRVNLGQLLKKIDIIINTEISHASLLGDIHVNTKLFTIELLGRIKRRIKEIAVSYDKTNKKRV